VLHAGSVGLELLEVPLSGSLGLGLLHVKLQAHLPRRLL
jgi:hypothetical protein